MDVGISAQVESLDAAVSEWAQACIIVFGDGYFAITMTSRTMRGTNSRTSRSMSLAGNSRVHVGISAQADSFAEAVREWVQACSIVSGDGGVAIMMIGRTRRCKSRSNRSRTLAGNY